MEAPPLSDKQVEALRYVTTVEGGCWQVRCGTDIEEVASLREYQYLPGMEQAATEALAQPGTWIVLARP